MTKDFRPVTTQHKADHAEIFRRVAKALCKGKPAKNMYDNLRVAAYLSNEADKIDLAFQQSNVVQFPRDGAA